MDIKYFEIEAEYEVQKLWSLERIEVEKLVSVEPTFEPKAKYLIPTTYL